MGHTRMRFMQSTILTWTLSPTCQEDLQPCIWIHSRPLEPINLQNCVSLSCHCALFRRRHPPAIAHFPVHIVGHELRYLGSACAIMGCQTRIMVTGRPPEILLATSCSTSCPTSSSTQEQTRTKQKEARNTSIISPYGRWH